MLKPLLPLAILLTLVGCDAFKKQSRLEDGRDYKEAYEQEVRKNRELNSNYLKSLTREIERSGLTFESHTLLSQLLTATNKLDEASEKFLATLKAERSKLQTNNRNGLSASLSLVNNGLAWVLVAIGDIEKLLSDGVLKQLKKNADADIIIDPENWKKTYEEAAQLSEHLQGTRNAYLLLAEDFKHMADIRVTELGGGPLPETTPAPVSTIRPNPLSADAQTGGRVIGFARDSQTGAAIARAEVGFKHDPGNVPYFHQTTTNEQGGYTSPYLLPGRYYVDIKKEGLAVSRDGAIEITRGVDRQSNFTLTEPIAAGKLRIVMSWCNDRVRDAVSDVDSYLEIPGSDQPLHYPLKGRMYEQAHLDLDDIDWEGPETTTIHQIRRGTYKFYVNNFNTRQNRQALGNSEIRVEVYEGNRKIKDYRVPTGIGLNYEVFHIIDGQIQDVKQFNDSLYMARH